MVRPVVWRAVLVALLGLGWPRRARHKLAGQEADGIRSVVDGRASGVRVSGGRMLSCLVLSDAAAASLRCLHSVASGQLMTIKPSSPRLICIL